MCYNEGAIIYLKWCQGFPSFHFHSLIPAVDLSTVLRRQRCNCLAQLQTVNSFSQRPVNLNHIQVAILSVNYIIKILILHSRLTMLHCWSGRGIWLLLHNRLTILHCWSGRGNITSSSQQTDYASLLKWSGNMTSSVSLNAKWVCEWEEFISLSGDTSFQAINCTATEFRSQQKKKHTQKLLLT